jgi:hypothetical protein
MFNHIDIPFVNELEREEIEGVRHYVVPNTQDVKFVSITSVLSWINRDKFAKWRKKVGNEVANEILRKSSSRGTDMHTLTEHYLKNESLPKVNPLPEMLFKIAKPDLNNIDNIHGLEKRLYSMNLKVAGTVDCIAEYTGESGEPELAIIDFKTSKAPKPRSWVDGYFVQCAAYACMLYELTGIIVKKFVIIMSCENGECEVYEEYDKAKYINMLGEYLRRFNEK